MKLNDTGELAKKVNISTRYKVIQIGKRIIGF